MRHRWLIRHKLFLGLAMLMLIVAILAFSSFRGVYAYRALARSISHHRAAELRLVSELSYQIGELRTVLNQVRRREDLRRLTHCNQELRERFRVIFLDANDKLQKYQERLDAFERDACVGWEMPLQEPERQALAEIRIALHRVAQLNSDEAWVMNRVYVEALDEALVDAHTAAMKLPFYLQQRMHEIVSEVRGQYRTWIALTWVSSFASLVIFGVLLIFIYRSIFRPLRSLVHGSRRVAVARDFDHRIHLDTQDEIAELADAMNAMTDQFQRVRDDLAQQIRERDEQVRQRTKAVVRSEKMASLGLLAAGVAHEINNPLTSVAGCAEALESRLHDIIQEDDCLPDDQHNPEIDVLRRYLRRIQDEAFRCKTITEQLLDFSRLGDCQRQETELGDLVEGVIAMVGHLGCYRDKQVVFRQPESVWAMVNPQEIKQVVLNLITNALDSVEAHGTVRVELRRSAGMAELEVSDDGCGMTDEVKQHLFEPFFTRRRNGQGTGLGLSITYGIVRDHGGEIVPFSDGPGSGSRFLVTLPLVAQQEHLYETKNKVA
ncbi:MAG: HAMP domain-containing protein [Planctomycetaceae bacterium]|nr:MAG: HAMP domain-containing protein [Planctomycetaceae bacterium]